MSTYTIKNFRAFRGHEGEPLAQGTLHGPKGKVADWSDDGHGGEMHVRFVNREAESHFVAFARTYLPTKLNYDGKPFDPATMTEHMIVLNAVTEMSVEAAEVAQVTKLAKKGITYYQRDPRAPRGKALYATKLPYTPERVAKLRAAVPDLLEIVNERLGLPFDDEEQVKAQRRIAHLTKLCKKNLVFTLRNEDGTLADKKLAVPYSASQAAALRARFPNLVEIFNERFL